MRAEENTLIGVQRSRRNLMRIGAIAGAALIAKAKTVGAEDFDRDRDRHWDWSKDRDRHRDDRQCFLRGTMVRTAEGDRKIENLAVGDLLPTVFGGTRAIQWIGRYQYRKSDPAKAWVRSILPIRIARSALGPDVPYSDLYVTETHVLLIDGVLVQAGNLVNDMTITRYDARDLDELEFFH